MLGMYVSVVGDHIPCTVRSRLQVHYTSVADYLGTGDLCRLGVSMRHAVGIDVTFDGVEDRADEMPLVEQRKAARRLVDREHLELHAEITAARLRHLQPVEPLSGARQHEAAGEVHAAGLAGNALDL